MTQKNERRLEELEIQLNEVELEKAKVELEHLRHQTAVNADEAREKRAAADKAELDLEDKRIALKLRSVSHGPTVDMHRGVFRLEQPVYSAVLELTGIIQRWADEHPEEPITLYIFSRGGSVFHGFALYDTLRTLSEQGHEVTTVIRGFAGSMASVIFLAGDVRKIGAESMIHQHEASSDAIGSKSEIQDEAEFMKKLEAQITRIYTSRTNMTARQFLTKIRRKDWYANAQEAFDLGIATEVG